MKKFKVVAESTIMDAEVNLRYKDEAEAMFENFKNSGNYHAVYMINAETGELYRTYEVQLEGGGVKTVEWFSINN